jgi:hypothetical protein
MPPLNYTQVYLEKCHESLHVNGVRWNSEEQICNPFWLYAHAVDALDLYHSTQEGRFYQLAVDFFLMPISYFLMSFMSHVLWSLLLAIISVHSGRLAMQVASRGDDSKWKWNED